MRLLLVEDDRLMAQMTSALLAKKNFKVTLAHSKDDAIDILRNYQFDAVVLDLRLKNECGLDVLSEARAMRVTCPFVVLSGDLDTDRKVAALHAGADDYVTKPFKVEELAARILGIIRRANGHISTCLEHGPLRLNLEAKTAELAGKPLTLTRKEYQVLEALMLRAGRILSKDMILSLIYGGIDEPNTKIIDVFICKLRKKLSEATGGENYIDTVWGRGYVLRDPEAGSEVATRNAISA